MFRHVHRLIAIFDPVRDPTTIDFAAVQGHVQVATGAVALRGR
jgi:hypothetical protein